MREEPQFARLGGVPVYDPGAADKAAILVCDLGAAIRRIEHRVQRDASPVRIEITEIDERRAEALLQDGTPRAGLGDDYDAQKKELIRRYVEVSAGLDVEWVSMSPASPAVWRVELPPVEQRLRRR